MLFSVCCCDGNLGGTGRRLGVFSYNLPKELKLTKEFLIINLQMEIVEIVSLWLFSSSSLISFVFEMTVCQKHETVETLLTQAFNSLNTTNQ